MMYHSTLGQEQESAFACRGVQSCLRPLHWAMDAVGFGGCQSGYGQDEERMRMKMVESVVGWTDADAHARCDASAGDGRFDPAANQRRRRS
jgi:hypothetical protein